VTWADGVIGAPIYERTTLVLDYSQKRAILEPRNRNDEPFVYDASGMDLTTTASDVVHVSNVDTDSPAGAAGIVAGDIVVSVDGMAATGERLDEIRQSLCKADERRRFVLIRDGREVRLDVHLRERI
jgi:S1-C subfamily serine protease